MSPKSFLLDDRQQAYLLAHCTPIDEVQQSLIDATAALGPVSGMQISPEQGAFLQLLAAALGARTAVEVGTFTGYSALCLARGMGPSGRLLCCDVSEEWTAIARTAWAEAGVEDRIDLQLRPAAETLAALPEEEVFDLAFIDADKAGYATYFEEILRRLRPNGVVLVDNVLWSGKVLDDSATDPDTTAIKAFNAMVAADPRVEAAMLPLADGLTVLRKR